MLPFLAKQIGLNEAIFLQQLHYWLGKSKNEHDERRWTYNTYEEWKEQFPFWSLRTMQRVVASLLEQHLIVVHQFGAADWDRKNWYSIEYDTLASLERQIGGFEHAKMASSRRPKRRALEHAKMARSSITEIPTENTTETSTENPPFHGDEFLTTLTDFEEHRKEIKKPLKPTGRKQLYARLEGLGESRAVAALRYSMAQGWTGVFGEHNNGHNNGHRDAADRNAERLKANLAIVEELRGEAGGNYF